MFRVVLVMVGRSEWVVTRQRPLYDCSWYNFESEHAPPPPRTCVKTLIKYTLAVLYV